MTIVLPPNRWYNINVIKGKQNLKLEEIKMKKIYFEKETGAMLITVSSAATIENFVDSLTAETEGYTLCGGGDDFIDDMDCEEIQFVRDNWNGLEEVNKEEENEIIAYLADCWGLEEEDIDYLR